MDVHRHEIAPELFKLRNLRKDLEDAKDAFRQAVKDTDSKSYIYVFCEQLATLFAKLSNIRMSHVIYGFQHPHRQWEGILALDIWYNLLYREIDAKYPFDEAIFNRNPMTVDGNDYSWDESLFKKIVENAKGIRDRRKECVTPRGVLKKIYTIVNSTLPR